MTTVTAEQARALLDGTTNGPWAWEINLKHKSVELTGGRQTMAGGDLTVMSFARWGMNGAAPVFWTWRGFTADKRQRANELAVAATGRDHHKDWFARIDHPDARLIASAPALAATVIADDAEKARLAARIKELEAAGTENAALKADAARYRWLRGRDLTVIYEGGVFAGRTPQNVALNGEDLDDTVDAALRAHEQEGA